MAFYIENGYEPIPPRFLPPGQQDKYLRCPDGTLCQGCCVVGQHLPKTQRIRYNQRNSSRNILQNPNSLLQKYLPTPLPSSSNIPLPHSKSTPSFLPSSDVSTETNRISITSTSTRKITPQFIPHHSDPLHQQIPPKDLYEFSLRNPYSKPTYRIKPSDYYYNKKIQTTSSPDVDNFNKRFQPFQLPKFQKPFHKSFVTPSTPPSLPDIHEIEKIVHETPTFRFNRIQQVSPIRNENSYFDLQSILKDLESRADTYNTQPFSDINDID